MSKRFQETLEKVISEKGSTGIICLNAMSWGPVTVLQYHSHLFHTRVPLCCHRRRQRVCGGDPPRGLSDETTSLGTMATAMERKPTPALQLLAAWRLLLGEITACNKGQPGCVVEQGELQGFWLQPYLQQHRQNDPKGWLQAIQQQL